MDVTCDSVSSISSRMTSPMGTVGQVTTNKPKKKKRKRMAELKKARAISGQAAGENQHDLQAGTVNIGMHTKVGDLERLIRRKQGKMAVIDEKVDPFDWTNPMSFSVLRTSMAGLPWTRPSKIKAYSNHYGSGWTSRC